MSKEMISDFILKNNNLTIFQSFENNENKTKFSQFLKRQKMFQEKLDSDKNKMIRNINNELFSNIQGSPHIDEKSKKIINDKKRKEKLNKGNKINIMQPLINSEKYHTNRNSKNNIKTFVNTDIKDNKQKKYTFEKRKGNNKLEININNNNEEINNVKRNNSESNIRIKKRQKEIRLHTNQNNKYIKKSKSSKFIYMDRIKEKKNYNAIIKYNAMSPTVKMKKIEINNINDEIDNICQGNIDFFYFCRLLFHFGFVNIEHDEKYINKYNEFDKNDEIIDSLLIHSYFDVDLITKEFIFKEINIIKQAFKSIHENFVIPENEVIKQIDLSDINYNISIQQFKLFIFILTNLFEGFDIDDIKYITEKKKNIKQNNKSEEENKNDNSKRFYETKSNNLIIYDLLKKIIIIKNIDKFTTDFINDYKNYFVYMIKTYENFKYLSDIQKKEKKKIPKNEFNQDQAELSFKPKINKNIKKPARYMNFIEYNHAKKEKNIENKNQNIKNYISDIDNLFTFKPKVQSPNLKKIFEKSQSQFKNERKDNSKKLENIFGVLKQNLQIKKEEKKNLIDLKQPKYISKEKNIKNNNPNDKTDEVTSNKNMINNKNYEFNNKKAKVQAKNNIKNKSYNKANTHRIRKNNVKSVIMLQIKNNGKNSQLIIYPEEDYKEVINNFCINNKIESDQYMKLLEVVRYKINQMNN